MRLRAILGRMGTTGLICLALGPAALPTFCHAGGVSDQIMQPGLYSAAPGGEVLRYRVERSLAPAPGAGWPGAGHGIALPEALQGAALVLERAEATPDRLRLTLAPDATAPGRVLSELPQAAPNPVLLFWLENIVRAASVQTGGSPFYLRNRIREALVAAEISPDAAGISHLELTPFAALGAEERARLGAFAGLRLGIRWHQASPGRILELKADTSGDGEAAPGGYHEHLILQPEE